VTLRQSTREDHCVFLYSALAPFSKPRTSTHPFSPSPTPVHRNSPYLAWTFFYSLRRSLRLRFFAGAHAASIALSFSVFPYLVSFFSLRSVGLPLPFNRHNHHDRDRPRFFLFSRSMPDRFVSRNAPSFKTCCAVASASLRISPPSTRICTERVRLKVSSCTYCRRALRHILTVSFWSFLLPFSVKRSRRFFSMISDALLGRADDRRSQSF